jgi:hypothetical protein
MLIAGVARQLGMDPAVIAEEPDPRRNSARYAAAIIYQQADKKQEQEQEARSKGRR